MPLAAVTAATCLSAAIGCFLMGALARYPLALAPGMGLNAYFTYTVVKGMGVAWQAALGAVFLSGVLFLVLTAFGIRQMILESIPKELCAAAAVGIGLFIAVIGFRNAGIIVQDPATLLTLGNLAGGQTLLALGGLAGTAALMGRGVRSAILLGILGTTAAGVLTGQVVWKPQPYSPAALGETFLKLDITGALRLGFLEIIFVFLFVDLFDNIGTLVAVGKRAGLVDSHGRIPRVNRILTSDALATMCGAMCGTSTVVSYIESAAGVAAGGKTGITAIVTGLLFLLALFVAPVAGALPAAATAPALILVGALMVMHTGEVNWHEPLTAIPAFLTLTTIPLTFSIANGLAFGFTAYTVLHVLAGRWRQINWMTYLLTALFLLRFAYLGRT